MAKKKLTTQDIKHSTPSDLEEWNIAENNWRRYERARDSGHLDWVEVAKKCDAYYRGDQWELADKQMLEAQGRPALTINTILSTINTVLGEQTLKRGMVNFKPKRTGSEQTATILNKLYSVIHDQNDLTHKESQVFSDGLIQDRGYFEVGIDFSENIEGEVRVTVEDPLDIYIDPDAKDCDPDTWQEVMKSRWLSMNEIEMLYGVEKVDKLRALVDGNQYYGPDSIYVTHNRFGDSPDSWMGPYNAAYLPEHEQRQIRRVRVIERQHKIPYRCWYFVNPEHGDMAKIPASWDEEKIATHAQQYGLMRVPREEMKIRYTITCDKVVLHDDWSIYPFFTIVPYFPYFRRGRPFGMVRNLISPQEQLNKVSSQELHVVNTTANSGWVIESGSLANMDVDDLEHKGATTGLVLEFHKGAQPPSKIPPNQIPTGLERIGLKAAMNIKEISGISDAMLGTAPASVSGVALESKQERGAVQIQVAIDNLNRSRAQLAKRVLHLVQEYYDNPRVFYITEGQQEDNPQAVEVNKQMPDGSTFNDLSVGDYDVDVTSQPARDVYSDQQFAEAMALRAAGVVIPDDSVIEYSHLENKREIAEKVRQLTGTAEPTQEQVQMEQAMRDIQFKQIEMQLAQMKAQIQNMESDTALKMAKAKTELLTDDTAEMEEFKIHADQIMNVQDNMTKLEIAKLKAEQEYQSKQTENQTRIKTATIREAGAREQNASKVAVELTKLKQQRNQLAGAKNE
jgi:hypothetical protein